jgi:uncharacterized membrane protein YgcG
MEIALAIIGLAALVATVIFIMDRRRKKAYQGYLKKREESDLKQFERRREEFMKIKASTDVRILGRVGSIVRKENNKPTPPPVRSVPSSSKQADDDPPKRADTTGYTPNYWPDTSSFISFDLGSNSDSSSSSDTSSSSDSSSSPDFGGGDSGGAGAGGDY